MAFGAFSVLLIKVVHPRVSAFVDGFSPAAITAASAALFLTGAADCMVTVRHILALNGRLAEIQAAIDAYRAQSRQRAEALGQRLQARLEESAAASGLEELRERLEERFEESVHNSRRVQALLELRSFQDRRLLRAFPHLSSTRYGDALKKLRERIEQRRS